MTESEFESIDEQIAAQVSTQSQSDDNLHRIYVGGMDPPRLTVDMVLNRMKSTVFQKLDILEVDDGKKSNLDKKLEEWSTDEDQRSFFFVTARAKDTILTNTTTTKNSIDETHANGSSKTNDNTNKTESALDVVSNAYHNVKWKGCRLRVEAAKLHFLERLRLEREMRLKLVEEKRKQEKEREQQEESQKHKKIEEARPIITSTRRHLRIRKRHGEEAYAIDTKPLCIPSPGDWAELRRMLQKQRSKRKKHLDAYVMLRRHGKKKLDASGFNLGENEKQILREVNSLNNKTFLNRGIHLRFAIDNDSKDGTTGGNLLKTISSQTCVLTEENLESDEPRTSSEDEESSSDESDDVNIGDNDNTYSWSDEEDNETGESKTAHNNNDQNIMDKEKNILPSDSSGDDESLSSEESISNLKLKHGNSEKADDESVSSEKSISDQKVLSKNEIIDLPSEEEKDLISSQKGKSASLLDTANQETEKNKEANNSQNDLCPGAYDWSSDEDTEDSEEEIQSRNNQNRGASFQSINTLDEFSSALNTDDNTLVVEDSTHPNDQDASNEYSSQSISLEDDVTLNLNVLAKLFPDMSGIKPREVEWNPLYDENESNEGNTATNSSHDASQIQRGREPQRPGWGSGGLMQRYDPTAESSKHFEVEEKTIIETGNNSEGGEISLEGDKSQVVEESPQYNDSNDIMTGSDIKDIDADIITNSGKEQDMPEDDNHEQQEDKSEQTNDVDKAEKEHIYEQGKLENIFQKARTGNETFGFQFGEVQKNEEINPTASESSGTNTGGFGGFNFSFDVKEPKTVDKRPELAQTNRDDSAAHTLNEVSDIDKELGKHLQSQIVDTNIKRRGMFFPKSILDKYEKDFFEMNEGSQIMNDWESMKDDEKSQSEWLEERRVLTLDWKRKHKHAESKKQKKMKYR